MEQLAPIIMLIVISLLSSLAKKKKSTAGQRTVRRVEERRREDRREEMAQEAERMLLEREMAKARQETKKEAPEWAQPAAPAYTPITPARMSGEGVDDCHEYMLEDRPATDSVIDAEAEKEQQEAARELVRGVIIGEILSRPRSLKGRRA